MAIGGEQAGRFEEKLKRELGELVLTALQDPRTEDVLLNEDGALWVKAQGTGFQRVGTMRASQALSAIGTVAAWRGTVVNHDKPILETELPIDGSRFEAVVPPVVTSPVFAIRVRPKQIFTLEQYRQSGILTTRADPLNATRRSATTFVDEVRAQKLDHTDIIRAAIAGKKNILIVGSTGSGKTTLVNACLHCISEVAPQDRVLIIEDTVELQCQQQNHVQLRAFGAVTMLDCLRACMRLKPIRIVVGEVRGAEALTLLKSWNTGHPGGVATVHANDALAGIRRMEALVGEATPAPQQHLIAEALDLVVFIDEETEVQAGRKVREVLAVVGYDTLRGEYLVEYL